MICLCMIWPRCDSYLAVVQWLRPSPRRGALPLSLRCWRTRSCLAWTNTWSITGEHAKRRTSAEAGCGEIARLDTYRRTDQTDQTDHLQIDQMDHLLIVPYLPLWEVVQDLHGTVPTQGTGAKSCGSNGSHPNPTRLTVHRVHHISTDRD